jgi:hypothetical protein
MSAVGKPQALTGQPGRVDAAGVQGNALVGLRSATGASPGHCAETGRCHESGVESHRQDAPWNS